MPNQKFYANLPTFSEFSGVGELDHYVSLPDDWVVLISDVVQSTIAIESGKYKQVNMVGAASIMCVLNVSDDIELPFSFGGDGGMIIVPGVIAHQCSKELEKLQSGCMAMFGLSLRAAAIPVSALREAGGEVLVRKFQLFGGNNLAMFAGEGTSMADDWLKSTDAKYAQYQLNADADAKPELEGLSCRWDPMKSQNGLMLTVIARQTGKVSGPTQSDLAGELATILKAPLSEFAPVKEASMKFRFPPKGLALEVSAGAKNSSSFKRYFRAYFTATMQYLCETFKIKIGDYDGRTYRDELIASTDFRKYDGALRMVLDVSETQARAIEEYLDAEYREGNLVFGTFRSDTALMTCMLFDLTQSRHLHLIDGADGGYALAAKAFKQRLADIAN